MKEVQFCKSIDENLVSTEKFPEILDKQNRVPYTDDIPCFLVWDHLQTDSPSLIYKGNFPDHQAAGDCMDHSGGIHLMNWYYKTDSAESVEQERS